MWKVLVELIGLLLDHGVIDDIRCDVGSGDAGIVLETVDQVVYFFFKLIRIRGQLCSNAHLRIRDATGKEAMEGYIGGGELGHIASGEVVERVHNTIKHDLTHSRREHGGHRGAQGGSVRETPVV